MAEKRGGKIKKYGAPTDSPLVRPTSLVLVNFGAEYVSGENAAIYVHAVTNLYTMCYVSISLHQHSFRVIER